jgi:hypothetical protein
MFNAHEKKEILKAFDVVVSSVNALKCSQKMIFKAISGIDPTHREIMTKEEAIEKIKELKASNQQPFIHDDSTSAWMHQAISRFALTVGDVRQMKFGEHVDLLIMDRNVGDYTSGHKIKVFNPAKIGFSYATYIHGENETGLLKFDFGVVHAPFRWEINVAALGDKKYTWSPLTGGDCQRDIDFQSLDPRILVGWRGPCIRKTNLKHLPKKIRLYDNWWDDYGTKKYRDWLHKK